MISNHKKSFIQKPIAIFAALVVAFGITLFLTGFEMPGPRYSEQDHYPSKVALKLQQALQADPMLRNGHLRILWAWDWRWRYGAGLQVWGVENPAQQEAVIHHLEAIKSNLATGRFIKVQFLSGLPDSPPFGKVIGNSMIKGQAQK